MHAMERVRAYIEVDGRRRWTLFDSGAENTYVLRSVAAGAPARKMRRPRKARLGGEKHAIAHVCLLEAQVEGKPVEVTAFPIRAIGLDRKARRPIEVLFGAVAMQQWGIELDLKRERLDMSRYPDESVEF